MAIINVTGISGINSITAQSNTLNFYTAAGNTLSIGASVSGNITGNVTGNLTGNVTGNVTGAINSTGVSTITTLNATSLVGVTTAGITTAYIGSVNDGSISGARNMIINGAMEVSQRGTSFSNPGTQPPTYTLDRFFCQAATNNQTITQDTDAPTGFIRSLKLTMGTATTLDYMRVGTTIEGFNFSNLAFGTSSAKPFTISFWVKSSLTGNFGIGFRNSDSQGINLTVSRLSSYTINSANTWEYKTITIPGATSQTWNTTNGSAIAIYWDIGDSAARSGTVDTTWQTANTFYPVGLTGGTKVASTTGATWYITGVQLEAGTVATPFERRSYGQELALCQRYCYVGIPAGATGNTGLGVAQGGYGANNNIGYIYLNFPVNMRSGPTLEYDSIQYNNSGGATTPSSLAIGAVTTNSCQIQINGTATQITLGSIVNLRTTNTTGYLRFISEL